MELVRNKRKKKKDYDIAVTAEDALNIFTDGACLMHDRRKGGIGVRFVLYDENLSEVVIEPWLSGYSDATNNEMELQACVEALRYAIKHDLANGKQRILIFSDSMYVVENFGRAKFTWRENDWCNHNGRPMENADQWKELVKLVIKIRKPLEIRKVKAHAQDQNNNAVDKLAKRSAGGPLRNPISNKSVRRKRTNEVTCRGSVKMDGQKARIRIVSSEYERQHGLFKLRYEVITESSPYRGKVDFIFSNWALRDGHTYYVVFNDQDENPQIKNVIRECK